MSVSTGLQAKTIHRLLEVNPLKHGPSKGFDFNLDYCKGCGICVAECPCGAIKMVPEDI